VAGSCEYGDESAGSGATELVFCVVTPCSPVGFDQLFGGTYCLSLKDRLYLEEDGFTFHTSPFHHRSNLNSSIGSEHFVRRVCISTVRVPIPHACPE
jgi:hypothetical protein